MLPGWTEGTPLLNDVTQKKQSREEEDPVLKPLLEGQSSKWVIFTASSLFFLIFTFVKHRGWVLFHKNGEQIGYGTAGVFMSKFMIPL